MERTIIKYTSIRLNARVKAIIASGICMLCLALFASAAYNKVFEYQTFVSGLAKVAIIGGAAKYLAWLVPVAEIAIGVLLIIPKTQRLGLYGFVGLMSVFTIYILSMLFWAEKLPCHCNLIIDKLSWGGRVWFNAIFIALAVFALWLGKANGKIK